MDCSLLAEENAIIYVRTDMREFTLKTTLEALIKAFPKHDVTQILQPFTKPTQTDLYNVVKPLK